MRHRPLLGAHLAAIMLGGVIIGCGDSRSAKQIVFVLPDQFAGPFIIVEAPDGAELVDKDDICEIVVPSSGIVSVVSFHPFEEMRRWRARFASGKELAVDEVADADVALRGGRTVSRNRRPPRMEFIVGTAEDYKECDFVAVFGE